MQTFCIGRFDESSTEKRPTESVAARTLAAGLVKTAYIGNEASLEDRFKSEKALRFYEVPRGLHPYDQMEILAQRIFAHYKIDGGKTDE